MDELHGLGDLLTRLPSAQREAFVLTQISGCPTPRRPSCAAWRSARSAPEWLRSRRARRPGSGCAGGLRGRGRSRRDGRDDSRNANRSVVVIAATGAIAVVVSRHSRRPRTTCPGSSPRTSERQPSTAPPHEFPDWLVRPIDLGNELELRNDTGVDVDPCSATRVSVPARRSTRRVRESSITGDVPEPNPRRQDTRAWLRRSDRGAGVEPAALGNRRAGMIIGPTGWAPKTRPR